MQLGCCSFLVRQGIGHAVPLKSSDLCLLKAMEETRNPSHIEYNPAAPVPQDMLGDLRRIKDAKTWVSAHDVPEEYSTDDMNLLANIIEVGVPPVTCYEEQEQEFLLRGESRSRCVLDLVSVRMRRCHCVPCTHQEFCRLATCILGSEQRSCVPEACSLHAPRCSAAVTHNKDERYAFSIHRT